MVQVTQGENKMHEEVKYNVKRENKGLREKIKAQKPRRKMKG